MKNKLITVVLVLLSLCLIAAVVNIGKRDNDGGLGGSSSGGSSSGSDDDSSDSSSATYSWIDPETGLDIFDYENVLTFAEGRECEIFYGDVSFEGGNAVLHADGSIDIPSALDSVDDAAGFTISIGDYELDSNCRYYFYYSRQIDGEYERCGLGQEETNGDGRYDIDIGVGDTADGAWAFGMYEPSIAGINCNFTVRNGIDGTMTIIETGTFYLRVIAVPK